jgi:phosphate transport system substrate-binding protein
VAGKRHRARLAVAAALRTGIAALVVLVAAAACGTAASTDGTNRAATTTAVSGPDATITEAGSSLLYPLAQDWANAYKAQSGVTVDTADPGSSKGIAEASAGQVEIGASDAYLSSGDLVKNTALLNIPLTISAQTVIYNLPELSPQTHVQLDGQVLAEIYGGTVTTWSAGAIRKLNPGLTLPNVPIVPVVRSDGSGDTFLFTSYLSTQYPTWDDTIGYGTTVKWPQVQAELPAKGSTGVLSKCEETLGCIAYNGISYLQKATSHGLGYAALYNFAGRYTLPTATAITDSVGSFVTITPPNETISMINGPSQYGYPIVNFEYAIVSTRQPDAAKASMIKAFLTWVITKGNAPSYLAGLGLGFQPLPPTVAALGAAQIAEISS